MIGEPLDEDQIVDILKREYEAAKDYCEGELRDEQDAALRYFEAESFGNEEEGRSKVVLPDVQEACDYMKISMLAPFVSGDMVVEFEAEQEEDEAGAEDATHAIQYSFMRQQDGYRVLHDWIDSALKEKIGAVKTTVITETRVSRETVQIDPIQMAAIEAMGDEAQMLIGDAEVENVNENEDGTFNVVLKRQVKRKRFIDIPIPSEELRFKRRTKHEDDTDYIAHVVPMTRSELVDMGFDAEQVYALTLDDEEDYNERDDTRGEDYSWRDEESSEALQILQFCEEYARIDMDGDGIAERVKICRVGDEILRYADGEPAIETIDEQPIVVFTPYPRAHRMVGISLAEKVMDLQLLRSTTARQLMDGMYNSNMPRFWIPEQSLGDNTLDDLLNPIPGSPVRGGNGPPPQDMSGTFDVGKSLQVMELWTGERETRTGITRLNQGLSDDTLNKTASGMLSMQAKGEQHEEFLARNFAECLARLFAKKYRLMKREGEKFRVKVDGQYREADPTTWPEEMNIQIRVGLGTNSKQKRIQARMMLAPILAEGKLEGMVTDKHLFNAVDGLVRDLGLGKGADFWVDPEAPPKVDPETGQPIEKPEKPDPMAMEIQAKQQEMQTKMQLEQAKVQSTLQMEQMKAQAQVEAERERNAMQMQVAREKAELEAELARDKARFEAELAREKMTFEQQMAMMSRDANMPVNRPGGDLDK